MKKLASLPSPGFPYFERIVEAKYSPRRELLTGISGTVASRYTTYTENTASLELLQRIQLTAAEKEALLHCYKVPTDPLNRLKADIRQHHRVQCAAAAALCQYCGLNHDASDFDHYLPKEQFAEFSAFSVNLVPCCKRCNELKSSSWLDPAGRRMIVSFYFDAMPTRQFLNAAIDMTGVPLATFSLSGDSADYCGLEATIRNHFTQLDLLNRFSLAAPEQFADIPEELAPCVRAEGIDAASELLARKAQHSASSHSPNYWKVALYQAMSTSRDYLSSLQALRI